MENYDDVLYSKSHNISSNISSEKNFNKKGHSRNRTVVCLRQRIG